MIPKKTMQALLLLLLTTFVSAYPAAAKKNFRIKGHCGYYYSSREKLKTEKAPYLRFYDFKKGETIASIGAQCGSEEASFAALTDSLCFYLQDIDSTYCNNRQAGFAWNYYDTLGNAHNTRSSYRIVIGGEKKTLLPDNNFDKILITNTFHEFAFPDEMLQDISRKLKAGGTLFIHEAVPRKPGQLHGNCKKTMYTADELKAKLEANGFTYISMLVPPSGNKKRINHCVYAFVLKAKT